MGLKRNLVLTGGAMVLALGAAGVTLAGADVDCSMCHDSAPLPEGHMSVEEVSVAACTMCHEASGEDPFFRSVHETHGEALGCDTCHSDDSPDRAAELKEILGN